MDKNMKRGLELGVGVTYLALDAVNETLNRLEKEGKINRKDSEKAVREVIKQYQSQSSKYAKEAQKQVDAIIKSNKIVTKKDLVRIDAEIKKLNKIVKRYMK